MPTKDTPLRDADKMLDELGMRLLKAGDKEGWNVCDEVGHIIRAATPQPKHCPWCEQELPHE